MSSGAPGRALSLGREPRALRIASWLGLMVVASVAAAIAFNGNLALSILPIAGSLLLVALLKLPVRVPLMVLIFAGLTLENPGDVPAVDLWHTPLYPVGKVLMAQLKHTVPIGGLVVAGVDLILLMLAAIYAHRRLNGSTIDSEGVLKMPRPLAAAAVIMVCAAAAFWVWGALRGGSSRFAMWQVHHVVYLPLLFLFLYVVIPGRAQLKTIATLVLAAACFKAVLAIYVRARFPQAEYATTHHDSMLFATAVCMVVAYLAEARSRRALLLSALLLPLLTWGMVANDRRLVWVECWLALAFMFFLWRRSRLKVFLARAALLSIPLVIVYVIVGWGSTSTIFAPVSTLRTVLDSKADMSSEWRDLENFNLVSTLRSHPLTGTGFGHPFEFAVLLPDVMDEYELEPYLPHNSVLGLWAYTGYIGFTALWMLLVLSLYFSARAYRVAVRPIDRAAALTCFAAIIVYIIHCYGDLALGSWTSIFLMSLALVFSGKLAVATGAWRVKSKRPLRALPSARPAEPLF